MDVATPLPTGTVTFLFTDIEGSTRLWEQQPEAMGQALARHNDILHHAISAHGGRVFKTVGDQFCAVFARARDALDAAVAGQRALLDAPLPFRVRVAVHTGEAQEQEGDYHGPALNRVARLVTAAHGGQVLLSEATARTIGPPFSEELRLRWLGVHRLRDLADSEAIYQLLSPGLPADFPPPNTLDVAFRRGMRRAAVMAAGVIVVLAGLALFANEQRQIAVRGQRTLRRHLYAAQMSVAQQAWSLGNVGRTQELVEAQRPGPGEEDLRGFEWRYLWGVCERDIRFTLAGHQAAVTSVAFSPDGSMIASASDDGTVKLWNRTTRQLVGTLAGQAGLLHAVRFSPDGKTLASGGTDGSIWLWDLAARRRRTSLRAAGQVFLHVTFAPDGRTLASVSWPNDDSVPPRVTVWDLSSGREIARMRSSHASRGAAFSPDGRLLVFADAGLVHLWDRAAKRIVSSFPGPRGDIIGLAFSPDGRTVAWGDGSGTVGLWDAMAKREVARLRGPKAPVGAVVFSPDGKSLAASSDDLSICLWDLATKRERAVLRGHAQLIWDLAFSPDGTLLASASSDRTVKVWNAVPRREVDAVGIRSQSQSGLPVAFSRDGRLMAVGDGKKGVRLWEIATGRAAGVLGRPGRESASAAFSPDGRLLACGETDGKVALWDLTSRHEISELRGHRGPVNAVAFSPDGRLVASGRQEASTSGQPLGEVKVWDVPTRRMLATLTKVQSDFVAFSPDGRLLAVGSAIERVVRRWEVGSWRPLPPLRAPSGWLGSAAFSPEGRLLASGTMEGSVYVWDVRTGQAVAVVQGHISDVNSLAFSPDGRTLATGSRDGSVKLWNVATWQEVAMLSRPGSDSAPLVTSIVWRGQGVVSVAFSPDGDRLVSVNSDGRAWVWRAAPLRETDAPDGDRIRPSPRLPRS